MEQIKIRYTWRRKSDGKLSQWVEWLVNIEQSSLLNVKEFLNPDWEPIARDVWTGEKDQDGVDIYEGDTVEYEWHDTATDSWEFGSGVVQFACGGFEPLPGYNKRNFKVTGSIHTHPELVKQ